MIERMLVHPTVRAVCLYHDDGSLGEGYGLLETEALERLARFARDYHRMMSANADQLAMFSDMPGWTPTRGWMVAGPNYTVLGRSNLVCLVDGDQPPVNQLLAELAALADM